MELFEGIEMADVVNAEKRKEIMSKVKSTRNKSTELKLIALFHEHGIKGWRRNYNVKGHPDFILLREKIAVFVDGCFWHGHNCRSIHPQTNADYWEKKISYNQEHDRVITMLFENRGWTVIRIWECSLKKANQTSTLEHIMQIIDEKRAQYATYGNLQ